MEKEMRQKEAVKVIKWIADYPSMACRMLNEDNIATPEECIEIIDSLEEKSLEYLVPILFYTVQYDADMENVLSRLYAEGLTNIWERMGTEKMLADVKSKIREEIRLKEARKNRTFQ